jgi:hypothetical protein
MLRSDAGTSRLPLQYVPVRGNSTHGDMML